MAIGIIAEYNPFHNGHLYQLKEIKKLYPKEEIVLILGGLFTERGEASIIDKWKKTDIAKHFGIDLIIELPTLYATQSADYFSYAALKILNDLKVDKLIFGSETDDVNTLTLIAKTELTHVDFDKLVKVYSALGNNYPTSISNAIYDLTGKKVDTPNDLLGVSYIKEIIKNNYNITPITIKRINNYHSKDLKEISSATAIREALINKKDIKNAVPPYVYNIIKKSNLHFIEDYYPYLKYKIIDEDNLSIYKDVDEGLDKLLKKRILESNDYNDLVNKLKSKRYTTNKIKRMLLHILLGIKKDSNKSDLYIRILGFNDLGKKYLNKVKKDCTLEILSKFKKDNDTLNLELKTGAIYSLPYNENLEINEYKRNVKGEIYDKN